MPARRWWLCVPPLVAFAADGTATALGQPPEYWAGQYDWVDEGNPLARWLLAVSPWLAAGAGLVYATGVTLVVRYWRHGTVVAFRLTASHTVGTCLWLIRLGWPGWVGVVAAYFGMERVWAGCRRRTIPP
jgi:hypothetical protein